MNSEYVAPTSIVDTSGDTLLAGMLPSVANAGPSMFPRVTTAVVADPAAAMVRTPMWTRIRYDISVTVPAVIAFDVPRTMPPGDHATLAPEIGRIVTVNFGVAVVQTSPSTTSFSFDDWGPT